MLLSCLSNSLPYISSRVCMFCASESIYVNKLNNDLSLKYIVVLFLAAVSYSGFCLMSSSIAEQAINKL